MFLRNIGVPITFSNKLKKFKLKHKSQCVVIKEIPDEVVHETNKQKVIGLFKRFKKLRAQTVEEPSTTMKPINEDEVIVETDNEDTDIDDVIANVSP